MIHQSNKQESNRMFAFWISNDSAWLIISLQIDVFLEYPLYPLIFGPKSIELEITAWKLG